MAVTRSAARALGQLTKPGVTKKSKTTRKRMMKAKANQENTTKKRFSVAKSTKANEKKAIIHDPPYRERLIEWITMKDPIDGVIPNKSELFSILQRIRGRKGCQVVSRARPSELNGIEWLVVEWQNLATRDKFLESELSESLTQALAPRSPKKELIWPIDCWDFHRVIRADPRYPPQKLYEILTTYFPVDLNDTALTTLRSLAPQCVFPEELVPNPGGQWHDKYADASEWHCGQSPVEAPIIVAEKIEVTGGFMNGFLYHERAWMEREIEFRGQPARRLIHIFRFEDEDGERCYKEEMKRRNTPRGRTSSNEWENFFLDLQDLGMIGYESQHARFLEVLERVSEDKVYLPGQFPMKRLPEFLVESSLGL
ncbi:uncharacterized protein N7503_001485 [Penicillium pulvis]|uniref:uncharacterized protein n=1 Tax=Penicillium pulvis TaxID=1562058 RepID=UPI002547B964|nr:uncharacterized protein N7503_001485 [Penicillium pulvis]KAJ5809267.1 hypothetical protein N7503_001485 [Penicillium pulvis]